MSRTLAVILAAVLCFTPVVTLMLYSYLEVRIPFTLANAFVFVAAATAMYAHLILTAQLLEQELAPFE